MKRTLIIVGIIIAVVAVGGFFVYPYKIQRVCFGDICPQNGGVFLMYRTHYTREECLERGAYPVEGIGWGPVYAGCSPINRQLSR